MAAAIQMSSTPSKEENLETAERQIRAAASSGADLVDLPEHHLDRLRRDFPALKNRRPGAYDWEAYEDRMGENP